MTSDLLDVLLFPPMIASMEKEFDQEDALFFLEEDV
jgi:hypothetical protein